MIDERRQNTVVIGIKLKAPTQIRSHFTGISFFYIELVHQQYRIAFSETQLDGLFKILFSFVELLRTIGCQTGIVNKHRINRQRSEEHTSELQSRPHLVCRLL